MARESPTYRADIEMIHNATGKYILSTMDVVRFLGKSKGYVEKHFDIPKGGITASALALQLSSMR